MVAEGRRHRGKDPGPVQHIDRQVEGTPQIVHARRRPLRRDHWSRRAGPARQIASYVDDVAEDGRSGR